MNTLKTFMCGEEVSYLLFIQQPHNQSYLINIRVLLSF